MKIISVRILYFQNLNSRPIIPLKLRPIHSLLFSYTLCIHSSSAISYSYSHLYLNSVHSSLFSYTLSIHACLATSYIFIPQVHTMHSPLFVHTLFMYANLLTYCGFTPISSQPVRLLLCRYTLYIHCSSDFRSFS